MNNKERMMKKNISFFNLVLLKMLNLNINMQSIELLSGCVSPNDKLRVSITTLPEDQKQAEIIEAKKLNLFKPKFKVQFKETTKKILIVIRKKNYIEGDPIVASTSIRTEELTNIFKERNNQDQKTVNLYESNKNSNETQKTYKIVGKIDINFFISEEMKIQQTQEKKNHKNEKKKYNEFSKIKSTKKDANEYLLFNDNYTN